jgi:hypothetical protein
VFKSNLQIGFGGKKQDEERAGEVLIKCGNNLKDYDKYKSLYGLAFIALGEGLKRIALEHADFDNRVCVFVFFFHFSFAPNY